jgi:preprotein translocase subunit SecE
MNGWIVVLVVVAVLGGTAFWLVRSGWWARSVEFLKEVRAELKKVSFPTREEVVATTIVVIVTSVVFAIYLGIADMLISRGYESLFRVVGS